MPDIIKAVRIGFAFRLTALILHNKGGVCMKRHLWKFFAAVTAVLFVVAVGIIAHVVSPFNPRNVSDKSVIENGTEYMVELNGISEYDENGFLPITEKFYFSKERMNVFVGDDGFAYTDYNNESDIVFDGRYSFAYIAYDDYIFCGESYKTKEELNKFFDSPDMIYNFDINNLSGYIQDIINYEKQFTGKATLKIYREKCVITEIYIGEEKVLELK